MGFNRFALFINIAVEVYPPTAHLEESLIHPPGIAHRPLMGLPTLLELWDVALHHRKMVVWVMAMPRSAIIWTRSRELSLNVRYHRTHLIITSSVNQRRRKSG
jgi:hypothetical protein